MSDPAARRWRAAQIADSPVKNVCTDTPDPLPMSGFAGNCNSVRKKKELQRADVLFGGIVGPLPFQAVRVSDIILVHFIERVVVDPVE